MRASTVEGVVLSGFAQLEGSVVQATWCNEFHVVLAGRDGFLYSGHLDADDQWHLRTFSAKPKHWLVATLVKEAPGAVCLGLGGLFTSEEMPVVFSIDAGAVFRMWGLQNRCGVL